MHIPFESSPTSSLGVEWELELVSRETRQLTSGASEILEEMSPGADHPKAKHELFQSTTPELHDTAVAILNLQERQRTPIKDPSAQPARAYFPADPTNLDGVGGTSRYFIVQGRLRLGDRVLEERSLIERRQPDIVVLARERINLRDGN